MIPLPVPGPRARFLVSGLPNARELAADRRVGVVFKPGKSGEVGEFRHALDPRIILTVSVEIH